MKELAERFPAMFQTLGNSNGVNIKKGCILKRITIKYV